MADIPRAYKLNKEKRASEEDGKFLYYFYDRKKLTSVALPEEQFDKLVEMDREYYNLERREHDHKTTFKKSANANGYKKIDIEKDDFGQASDEDPDDDDVSGVDFTYKIHKQCDIDKKVAALSPDDRTIYKMYYVDGFRQAEIAEELGKTQGYVAKRLMKIGDALQENKTDEDRANAQWEKFLQKFRTDDDEDILWDMFRVIMPVDDQAEMVSWFYSYREYYKFGLSYLVIRPFSKYKDDTIAELEFGNRLNELPHRSREIYYDIFDGQINELRWLYLALCEEVEYRKKTMKEKPKPTNFEKIFEEAEKACSRLDMTVEEFIHKRFLPQQYARLEKRYTDFRRKYKNIVVIEEDDPRPIREQIIDIFGEGPVPHFSNPEFRKKK